MRNATSETALTGVLGRHKATNRGPEQSVPATEGAYVCYVSNYDQNTEPIIG